MKRELQFLISLVCLALFHTPVRGATNYWDINGAIPGAGGDTPSGTWDTGITTNWTTDSTGASAGTTWASGDDAVFSAGTDASGSFNVTMEDSQIAGNITVEEGNVTIDFPGGFYPSLNIGNSTPGKGIVSVASGLNTTIVTPIEGGDDRGQFMKVGAGTLTLSGANFGLYGTNIIAEGVLVAADTVALGGDTFSPTIVSNGATLEIAVSGASDSVILHGNGVNGVGALRNSVGSSTWSLGATLGTDAKISMDWGGTWTWNGQRIECGTNNYNVTFGGDAGFLRLNISYPSVNVNNGAIYKEGNSLLGLDQPNYCSAFYFNGGAIRPRTQGLYGGFGSGNIYVGAGAGEFQTGENNDDPATLTRPMVLAAGANLTFNCQYVVANPSLVRSFACNGVISGLGGVSKTNAGSLFLNADNTYSGNTIIKWGPLVLNAGGSISNSPVIDVWSNGVFDVTAKAGTFVLQSAQTLKGNGVILGDVTANGTISPGASVGSLTFSNNLTLSGVLLIDIDKALAPSNDVITVIGTLTSAGGGAVTVANLGTSLAEGDTFQIFNQPVANGQTMSVTGAGVTWTNKLAVDGSIAVASLTPPPAIQVPRMTSVAVSGIPGVSVMWTNAIVGSNYWLQFNTNLNTTNWFDLAPVIATGSTASQTDGVNSGNISRYYRVRFLTSGGVPPAIVPRITSIGFSDKITLTLSYSNTLAGTNYVLQYNTNLNTTNWTSLNPVKASGTSSAAMDTFPASSVSRYYRVFGQF